MTPIAFDNSYARLPARFFARQSPVAVRAPALVRLNTGLAERLGLDAQALAAPEGVAWLAGNAVPPGAEPLAQAYAGHQFGGFTPQLGDGRALLLGEVIAPDGARFDWQLKGAGRTPFSRGGDGRAAIGPALREYLVSEAMAALGVPTTRALAAVTTGDWVLREARLPGAILSRVAPSHIRVGTFQYFAARRDIEALRELAEYTIARHYPGAEGALGLLAAACDAQARLVARWMGIGFIHGVMNTDNSHVGGITIDYGPCAFMDGYHPDTVFSSIDQFGRYAYANQPQIAVWNMGQFASTLLPLMGDNQDAAVDAATAVVQDFAETYQAAWLAVFRAKLGLTEAQDGDVGLIETLLGRMAVQGADFTRTFRGLADGAAAEEFREPEAFHAWARDWQARLALEGRDVAQAGALMVRANPAYIPRNHRIEAAIVAATAGDFAPFHRLCDVLARPYDDQPGAEDLALAPKAQELVAATFCGT
jgi:uncharacterized protein YdiU (UPF0061 family)